MILRIIYSFLYIFPFLMLVYITEVDTNHFQDSIKMGLISHFAFMSFTILLSFIVLRFMANKLINKTKHSEGVDYITSTNSMYVVFIGYILFFITFFISVIAYDISPYARWQRGLKEMSIISELEEVKSKREKEYISEALEESKAKNTEVYNRTNELYRKFTLFETNKHLLISEKKDQ